VEEEIKRAENKKHYQKASWYRATAKFSVSPRRTGVLLVPALKSENLVRSRLKENRCFIKVPVHTHPSGFGAEGIAVRGVGKGDGVPVDIVFLIACDEFKSSPAALGTGFERIVGFDTFE